MIFTESLRGEMMGKGERYMEFIRGQLYTSAANVFTEEVVQLPTSQTEKLAMLIHQIDIDLIAVDRIDATYVEKGGGLGLYSGSSRALHFAGVLCYDTLALSCTETADKFLAKFGRTTFEHKYDPPILVAQSVLYAKIQSMAFPGTTYFSYRIGYTLEKVASEAFIAALVRFVG